LATRNNSVSHVLSDWSQAGRPTARVSGEYRQQLASASFGAQPEFGGVILGVESESRLAGVYTCGFRQVDDGLDFVDGACFGKQAAGKLQSSER